MRAIADVATRTQARSGNLLRFHVPIADRPGALAEIGAVLDVVAEIQDRAHGEAVLEVLRARCFSPVIKGQ